MNKTRIIFISFLLILSPSSLLAQEKTVINTDNEILRNPFKPQIPLKKEEVIIAPSPSERNPRTTRRIEQRSQAQQTVQEIKPVATEVIPPPELLITGLVWNTDRPQAIINGQVVDIGDKISAVKIVSIDKTSIDIEFQDRILTIKP